MDGRIISSVSLPGEKGGIKSIDITLLVYDSDGAKQLSRIKRAINKGWKVSVKSYTCFLDNPKITGCLTLALEAEPGEIL